MRAGDSGCARIMQSGGNSINQLKPNELFIFCVDLLQNTFGHFSIFVTLDRECLRMSFVSRIVHM